MSTIINGTSSAITFPDTTVQNTAFTTGAVTQSTIGTNVAGTGPAFSAYSSTNQSISSGVITKVTFGTEEYDTNNNFASSRFTPTVAGYYQINAQAYANATSLLSFFQTLLYKNTTLIKIGTTYNGPVISEFSSNCNAIVYMNGTTDYIELSGYGTATGGIVLIGGGTFYTYISGALIRAA